MYAIETAINRKRREYINQPYELSIIQDQIHKFPECMRKSLKLNKHKHKASYIRSKPNHSLGSGSQDSKKLNINISICKALHKQKEIKMFNTLSPSKRPDQYENNTDRMMDQRKKLSPLKFPQKTKERKTLSEDSVRQKESPKHQTIFLNIEKLNLIKIYSQFQRSIDTARGSSIQSRYLKQKSEVLSPQDQGKNLREVVVNLRKTLRQGRAMKWPSSNFKVRTKQFIPPFQRYYYKDFIWKVAFSNGILLQCIPEQSKFKVFVGKGNNSQLVRSLLKRRGWWSFTQKWQQANLVWTQLKINQYFNLQANAQSADYQHRQHLSKEIIKRNEFNLKIMNENDVILWDNYSTKFRAVEEKIGQDLSKRKYYIKKNGLVVSTDKPIRMQNHFPQNYIIGNKKALLYTMTQYYDSIGKKVFNYLPLSFHIKKGINDQEYNVFLKRFYERRKDGKKNGYNNVWIVKPGQLTNRGNGIIVCFTLQQIKSIIKRGGNHDDGTPKTFILQQYIQQPFLYQRRKFDIRHYVLATSVNGKFKVYWFKRGYIRTSSNQYTLSHSSACVHLTNDAVQKLLPDYGRYQKGNKLSYEDFQVYLTKEYGNKYNFFDDVYPQMKAMATDALKASSFGIDPNKKQHNFELFGLDFMIDGQFKPWLIEINSNPCLELSCPLLSDIIPSLVQNTLKICVDSIVCPPNDFTQKRPRFQENALAKNQFELVYDSTLQNDCQKGELESSKYFFDKRQFEREDDEVFEDDGQAFDD